MRHRSSNHMDNRNFFQRITSFQWTVTASVLILVGFFYWEISCSEDRARRENSPATSTVTVTDLVAVVAHEPGQYTVSTLSADKTLVEDATCRQYGVKCVLKLDVPEGQPMYMTYGVNPYGYKSGGVIHIHGISSLTGGTWTEICGKGCRREHQTQIIDGVP